MKAWYRPDLREEDIVFFLHIPKAAGTSFYSLLCQRFAGKVAPYSDRDLTEMYHAGELCDMSKYRLLRAHMDVTIRKILPAEPRIVTMLRNPVERVISLYKYLRRTYQPEHRQVRDMPLKDFVDYAPGNYPARNYQTRMVAGYTYGKYQGDQPFDDPSILEEAKKTLDECLFVGLSERFFESSRLLSYTFDCAPFMEMSALNVAPERSSADRAPDEALEAMLGANQLDLQLYDYARSLFECRYGEMVRNCGGSDAGYECYDARSRLHVRMKEISTKIGREVASIRSAGS